MSDAGSAENKPMIHYSVLRHDYNMMATFFHRFSRLPVPCHPEIIPDTPAEIPCRVHQIDGLSFRYVLDTIKTHSH